MEQGSKNVVIQCVKAWLRPRLRVRLHCYSDPCDGRSRRGILDDDCFCECRRCRVAKWRDAFLDWLAKV